MKAEEESEPGTPRNPNVHYVPRKVYKILRYHEIRRLQRIRNALEDKEGFVPTASHRDWKGRLYSSLRASIRRLYKELETKVEIAQGRDDIQNLVASGHIAITPTCVLKSAMVTIGPGSEGVIFGPCAPLKVT